AYPQNGPLRARAPERDRRARLTLGELEPLARLRTAGLLPLHFPGIPGEQRLGAQPRAITIVDLHERPREPEPDRIGLAVQPAPGNPHEHVELAFRLRDDQRPQDRLPENAAREVVLERP